MPLDDATTEHPTRELNGAEALMGFLTWLSTRATPATFSARHDPQLAYDLFAQFTDVNACGTLGSDWPLCLTPIEEDAVPLAVAAVEASDGSR